jgi:RNA polymerase sigma factor (TIGR02999 family)
MPESAGSPKEISGLLKAWSGGTTEALNELLPVVYDELRKRAHNHLRRERKGHTLQTTGLIHEAFIKLVEQKTVEWQNRSHFFAISSNLMRQILVDYARSRGRVKRGGDAENLPLEEALLISAEERNVDLLALDDALNRLAEIDEQQARIVELRYFSGLSIAEVAETLGISIATVNRDWKMAKAWLNYELTK